MVEAAPHPPAPALQQRVIDRDHAAACRDLSTARRSAPRSAAQLIGRPVRLRRRTGARGECSQTRREPSSQRASLHTVRDPVCETWPSNQRSERLKRRLRETRRRAGATTRPANLGTCRSIGGDLSWAAATGLAPDRGIRSCDNPPLRGSRRCSFCVLARPTAQQPRPLTPPRLPTHAPRARAPLPLKSAK